MTTPTGHRIALLFLFGLAVVAVGADWLAPYGPTETAGPPFQAPTARHWLGTNDIGQDNLSALMHGTRASLTTALSTAALSLLIALAVGVTAGYFAGTVDAVLGGVMDVVLVIPAMPLMIVLAAFLGQSQANLIAVMSVLMWARPARIIRGAALSASTADYVLAVRALGADDAQVLRRHVLPAVLPVAVSQFSLIAGSAIGLGAALAFLGLADPARTSWGTILFYAHARHAFLTGHWLWWGVPPGLLIAATVLTCATLGLPREVPRA
jgi:peptide/nickel transport system ATP-binding protein/peptide/nickel transport system permease protein